MSQLHRPASGSVTLMGATGERRYNRECACGDSWTSVWEEEAVRLLNEHIEQESAKPTWTSTLPTESGWYWMRDLDCGVEPFIAEVEYDERAGGFCWADVSLQKDYFGDARIGADEAKHYEWWPIPLTAPEE